MSPQGVILEGFSLFDGCSGEGEERGANSSIRENMIPFEKGVNRFHIHVIRGALRINYGAYTPDGGTWLSAPAGRPRGYDLDEGDDEQITVDIQESQYESKSISKIDI